MRVNKAIYNQLFTDSSKLEEIEVSDLDELIKLFPYCQNLHQWKLKKLYQQESLFFETELPKTAVYTRNRSHLKRFIKEEALDKLKTYDVTSNNESLEIENAAIPEKPVDTSIEKPEGKLEEKPDENSTKEFELPSEAIAAAIDASVRMDVDAMEDTSSISDEENKEMVTPEVSILSSQQKMSFVDWVKTLDGEKQAKITEREQFKLKAAALIDQFIDNQPTIKADKTFFSAEDKAKESISDESEIVTETLAKVYLQQGHAKKAIEIYGKLSLRFPEKKTYFASLIKEAKKETN